MKKSLDRKKVALRKETLRNLGEESLVEAKGGITPVVVTLPIVALTIALVTD